MAETYDVFLSYNHVEKAAVGRIAKELGRHQVRVWFDEDAIKPGDSIPDKIEEGLSGSRVYAVCLGPGGFGNWHNQEVGAAIMQRIEQGQRLIPVLLPGVTTLNDAPVLVRALKPLLIQRQPAFPKSVEKLATMIISSRPPAASVGISPANAAPTAKDLNKSEDPVGEAIEELYTTVSRSGTLTFFLGAGSAEPNPTLPPPPYEIAQRLLEDLEFIGPTYAELIPPLDAASSYYAVKKSASKLEARVVELVKARSKCAPVLHQNLAAVVSQLARIRADVYRRRQVRTPQLIVTTSIDLMCERALLRAGLSFTRIVQHPSGAKVTINEYRDVAFVDDQLQISDRGKNTVIVPLDDSDQLDPVIKNNGFREVPSEGDKGEIQPIRTMDLSDSSDLVLYKYHGSHDVQDSCALSTEDYLRLAVTPYVPDKIKEIIVSSPALFLLCGILDADVRHVYHTLLRSAQSAGEKRPRVAVVRPPGDPEIDSYRRLEVRMWERAKTALAARMGMTVVEGDSAKFLNRFLTRFEEGAPSGV